MTVCANRSDNPGFFTSCFEANHGPCVCGAQVAADLAVAAQAGVPDAPSEGTPA